MERTKLYIGCTAQRHAQIGIDAVVNARGGLQHLNDRSLEDIELRRDAYKITDWQTKRIRFYQFNSKWARRNIDRLSYLLSSHADY